MNNNDKVNNEPVFIHFEHIGMDNFDSDDNMDNNEQNGDENMDIVDIVDIVDNVDNVNNNAVEEELDDNLDDDQHSIHESLRDEDENMNIVKEQTFEYISPNLYNTSVFEKFYAEGMWCDLTLEAEGRSFRVHRVLMIATIPYFHHILKPASTEPSFAVIQMNEIPGRTLATFIEFAYTGKLNITVENVDHLLKGAAFLMLHNVLDDCVKFILFHLKPTNCLFYLISKNFDVCKNIGRAADTYFELYFSQAVYTDHFLSLDSATLLTFVKRNRLCIESETEVYDAIMRWVRFSADTRVKALPALFKSIRLSQVSPSFLQNTMMSNDLIRDSSKLTGMISRALGAKALQENKRTGRLYVDGIYVLGEGVKPKSEFGECVEFRAAGADSWCTAAAASPPIYTQGAVMIDETIYVIGGASANAPISRISMYSMRANKWYAIDGTFHRRVHMGIAALNLDIYLCGGLDGANASNVFEIYHTDGNYCTRGPNMRKMRSELAVAAMGSYVYVVGGRNEDRVYTSAERYDPVRDTWRPISGMIQKRCQHACAVLNGVLYACGGNDGRRSLRLVEFYEARSNKWYSVTSMKQARSHLAVVASSNRLWAIGGYDGRRKLTSVERYNPLTDTWKISPSLEFHCGKVFATTYKPTDKDRNPDRCLI